jgi:hypothetical protein
MKVTVSDIVCLRSLAIFCSAVQKGASRLTLVFRPRNTIECLFGCLVTTDFDILISRTTGLHDAIARSRTNARCEGAFRATELRASLPGR